MKLNLTNTVEINAIQVAVDHLIEHLTDVVVWNDVDNDDMRLNIQSLIATARIKERILQGGIDNA